MRRVLSSFLLALVTILVAAPSSSAATIKLATLVPEGSVWDKELRKMADEVERRTDGRVELRIYPGGVAGDDSDVLRKMRIGQLGAATLSAIGLSELDPGFEVFSVLRFFRGYEELFAVVEAVTPMFAERLEEEGYVLLNWGHGGWVHLFSTEPVHTPADLKGLKIFSSAGDNEMIRWWKSNGYRPVALATTDIMTGLQTGMIEALPTTPLAALSLQWYRSTPYMFDLGLAPLVGATVIGERTWNRLSEEDRKILVEVGGQVEARLEAAVEDQEERAIAAMKGRGLTVTSPENEKQRAAWGEEAAVFARTMREMLVPDEVFAAAKKARDAYRQRAGEE